MIWTDTCSGSVPGDERLQFQAALEVARTGDTLVVWRLDQFVRNLQFVSLQENLDTTTLAGRFTFHLFGILAEFERDLIRECTQAGLQAARDRGRKGGHRRKVDDRMLARASEWMRERPLGINEICRIVGMGKTTLYRYLTLDGQRRGEKLPDMAR